MLDLFVFQHVYTLLSICVFYDFYLFSIFQYILPRIPSNAFWRVQSVLVNLIQNHGQISVM